MADIGELSPAELGLALVGHPTRGQAAVTIVDLADRGALRVEAFMNGDAVDWQVRCTGSPVKARRFEAAILDTIREGDDLTLGGPVERLSRLLDRFRDSLPRIESLDVEKTRAVARARRAELRQLCSSGATLDMSELPLALVFGLLSRTEMPQAQFVSAFVAATADLPGWNAARTPRSDEVPWSENPWGGLPPGASAAGFL